eukprot:1230336-Amphidinium_carterae.3
MVRHNKKRVKVGINWKWVNPIYSKLTRLPDGTKLRTKAGTQVIDSEWRCIRDHLRGLHIIRGSRKAELSIRSGQWLCWHGVRPTVGRGSYGPILVQVVPDQQPKLQHSGTVAACGELINKALLSTLIY